MATKSTDYEPGYCNIGDRERRSRLRVSLAGFGLALVVVLAVVAGVLPR